MVTSSSPPPSPHLDGGGGQGEWEGEKLRRGGSCWGQGAPLRKDMIRRRQGVEEDQWNCFVKRAKWIGWMEPGKKGEGS